MSGQKKQRSPTPSDETVAQWKTRLADLQRRAGVFHKAGMTDTAWDAQIIQLETLIAGANLEVITDGE